ncbi:MAG: hypothetical protein H0U98_12375 [Alphaproteobacteria bacterium]|nr:hypothetical protein [Alphaproteobacteria bacterium]
MTKSAYWDELGIAWCAVHSPLDIVIPRLKARLRGESLLIGLYVTAGLLLGIASAGLGAFTLWMGWTREAWFFVTRGTALVAVSAIMIVASLQLLPVMASEQATALPDMIDLSIARAERLVRVVRLGFAACAVTTVLGLAGTAIRNYSGKPPAMSPIWALGVTAVLALGLFWYGRHLGRTRAKFRYLQTVMADATGGTH